MADTNIEKLYEQTRTYRRFTEEKIPEDVLLQICNIAGRRSTARNAGMIRFGLVKSDEMVAKMQPLVKWAAALPKELGNPHEDEIPTAWIAVYYKGDANSWCDIDLGIAVDAICTTAMANGVGSCIMGAINVPKIKEALEIPEEDTLRVMIALGYPRCKSEIVGVPESGSLTYYVDENRDYYVPKQDFDTLTTIY